MAFRRIDVPAEGVLDDRKVTLGGHEDQFAYAENSRADFIVGGFTDKAKPKLRYYYLGKYEVTAEQYDAMGGKCPPPSEEGRLPKVSVTWAEAVAFASRYGAWLAREALEQATERGRQPGLRPPADGSGVGVRRARRARGLGLGLRAADVPDAGRTRSLRVVSGHRVPPTTS